MKSKERRINKPRKFDAVVFFDFKAKNVGIAIATVRLFNAEIEKKNKACPDALLGVKNLGLFVLRS